MARSLSEERESANRPSSGMLIWGAAATVPLVNLISSTLDTAQKVRDASGHYIWVSSGNAATLTFAAALVVLVALGLHVLAGCLYSRDLRWQSPLSPMVLAGLVIFGAQLVRGGVDGFSLVYYLGGLVILTAAACGSAGPRLMPALGRLGIVVVVSNVIYYISVPHLAANDCRSDKCSIAGDLVRGYYAHENSLALYIACLLPTMAYLDSRFWRWLGVSCTLLLTLATGSRAGIVAMVVGAFAYSYLRRLRRNGLRFDASALGLVARLCLVFPLAMLVMSAVIYLFADEGALTGRGFIYAITREALAEQWLIGPGREVLGQAYAAGQSAGFLIAHEHGEAPYLFTNGGVIAFFLVFIALLRLATVRDRAKHLVPALVTLPPAAGFVTEPIWEFSARSPYLWSMALVLSLGYLKAGTSSSEFTLEQPSEK